MNEQVIGTMFALIQGVVRGEKLSEATRAEITPERLPDLYAISKAHDVAHIVAQGLGDLGILGEDPISQKFQKQQMLAIYRYQQINYEQEQLCAALEDARIPFVPLKGAVLRGYYPEPWMRTSCDIDVLVHEEDLERASEVLEKTLSYQNQGKGSHDVSFFSPAGIHVELHFDTVEDDYANDASRVLSNLWEHTAPKSGCEAHFVLTDEMFYFYHIAHMAKHFEDGGCGVRPFLDLWILEHCVEHDNAARNALLEQGRFLTFANACRGLSAVWFDGAQTDETMRQIEAYILHGGVYGAVDNRVAVQQKKSGGKIRYALSRIILPYDILKIHYSVLEKHKWLTPFMQVRRWFKLLFRGGVKSSLYELNANRSMSQERIKGTAELLKKIGL